MGCVTASRRRRGGACVRVVGREARWIRGVEGVGVAASRVEEEEEDDEEDEDEDEEEDEEEEDGGWWLVQAEVGGGGVDVV